MFTQDFLDFFIELSTNNNKEWFDKNKKRYESSVKKPLEAFLVAWIKALQKIEPDIRIEPKDATFRINRDIRFSADKSPYKDHTGAVISKYGRKTPEYPGYYFHASAGMLMLGGGAYFLEKESLIKARDAVARYPNEFATLIADKNFVEKFGGIKGEKNAKLSADYKDAAEKQPLLFNKQFYFMAELEAQNLLRPDLIDFVMEYCRAGQPINHFFQKAIFG